MEAVRKSISFLSTILVALLLAMVPAWAANDTLFTDQWALQKIEAEKAWATSTGRGMTVAVLDSGVDFSHRDLAGKSAGSWDCLTGTCREVSGEDEHGHGTHVAGIIGAITANGRGVASVAPDVSILSIRVCGATTEEGCRNVGKGIRKAIELKANVINMSLGGEFPILDSVDFGKEFQDASNAGMVVAVAAGNDQQLISSYTGAPATVIVVSASGPDDERAAYTSGYLRADVYAPGGNSDNKKCGSASSCMIVSTWRGGSYKAVQGTSMAAPHAAGLAANLMCLGQSNHEAATRIRQTADNVQAGPRINAAKAVAGLRGGNCAANFPTTATQTGGTRPRATATKAPSGQQTAAPAGQAQPSQDGQGQPEQTSSSDAAATQEKKEDKPDRTMLNLIVGGALVGAIAAWFGWVRFKASRARP